MAILEDDDIQKVQEERDKLLAAEHRKASRADHNAQVFEELVAYAEELLYEFALEAKGIAEPELRVRNFFTPVGVYALRAPKTEFGITEERHVWAWVTDSGKGYGRYEKHGDWQRYYPTAYDSGLHTSERKKMVVCPLRAVAEYLTGEIIDEESLYRLSLEEGMEELKGIVMTGLKNL